MPTTRIPLIFGTGMFGSPGVPHIRTTDPAEAQKIIDVLVKHGHTGIDTARIYAEGTSEVMVGKLALKSVRVDTKVFPLAPGGHSPENIKATFQQSVTALGPNIKIRVYYLHAPDRSVPFEDSLEAVNELYRQGHFEELGLSNYMSWEVAEVVGICRRRGFVLATVYQGIYNCIGRTIETELIPCLRKFGIKFAAYSTLAGGFLTGKHMAPSGTFSGPAAGTHFDPSWNMGSFYLERYVSTASAVDALKTVAEKHGLKLAEVALRWLIHHSLMVPSDYGIIIGASRPEQLEASLSDCEKGPLPDDVVKACEDAWIKVRDGMPNYWL